MYGNQIKSEARLKAWDIVAGSTPQELKDDGWVVALAGRRFLDAKIAKRKGFRNVIGVDVDSGVVTHNTAHGRTVIQLPLSETLLAWPDSRPIAVVWADFCSNISSNEVGRSICSWLASNCCRDSSLFINVMKGRESNYKQITKFCEIVGYSGETRFLHRARTAMAVMLSAWMGVLEGRTLENPDDGQGPYRQGAFVERVLGMEQMMLVCADEYKAHKVCMNWAVYRNTDWSSYYYKAYDEEDVRVVSGTYCSPRSSRHITAKLAWHSMRQSRRAA